MHIQLVKLTVHMVYCNHGNYSKNNSYITLLCYPSHFVREEQLGCYIVDCPASSVAIYTNYTTMIRNYNLTNYTLQRNIHHQWTLHEEELWKSKPLSLKKHHILNIDVAMDYFKSKQLKPHPVLARLAITPADVYIAYLNQVNVGAA